jgi:hypothetical protein
MDGDCGPGRQQARRRCSPGQRARGVMQGRSRRGGGGVLDGVRGGEVARGAVRGGEVARM